MEDPQFKLVLAAMHEFERAVIGLLKDGWYIVGSPWQHGSHVCVAMQRVENQPMPAKPAPKK